MCGVGNTCIFSHKNLAKYKKKVIHQDKPKYINYTIPLGAPIRLCTLYIYLFTRMCVLRNFGNSNMMFAVYCGCTTSPKQLHLHKKKIARSKQQRIKYSYNSNMLCSSHPLCSMFYLSIIFDYIFSIKDFLSCCCVKFSFCLFF